MKRKFRQKYRDFYAVSTQSGLGGGMNPVPFSSWELAEESAKRKAEFFAFFDDSKYGVSLDKETYAVCGEISYYGDD